MKTLKIEKTTYKFIIGIVFIIIVLPSKYAISQEANPNGYNRFYYPNTKQVSSEGVLKNGKPEGLWKSYYITGVLKSEGKYNNNILDSIWVFYNQVGDTLEKINYKYGKKNGYYYSFKYDGKYGAAGRGYIASKELYLNDKRNGISYYYFNDGSLFRTLNYVEGNKQGLGIEYSKRGEIKTLLEYHNNYLINREAVNRVDKNDLKQGVWKEFYDNGKLHFERTYNDDQLNGYYKEYDENGNLRFAIRYENGKIVNETAEKTDEVEVRNVYDENGVLISSGTFKKEIPIGIHRNYDRSGTVIGSKIYDNKGIVISEGIINDRGERSGKWKDFYVTGEVRDEGAYANNKRTGQWKFYLKNKRIEQLGQYRNGRVHGIWKWYYDDGALLREEEYFNGKEEGIYVEYSNNGEIIAQGEFINGEKEGEWFYKEGDHVEKGMYITGLREGVWKYYYPGEKLKYSGNYMQGLPDGKHKYYYENGRVKEEQYYETGLKQKNWKKFDEEGNVILTISYKNDIERRINGVKIDLEEDIKRIK